MKVRIGKKTVDMGLTVFLKEAFEKSDNPYKSEFHLLAGWLVEFDQKMGI